MFYDVHSHQIEKQSGGLLLSIEGEPSVPAGISFAEWQKRSVPASFKVVPYLANLSDYMEQPIIYIHPRRNNFSVADVINYLKRSSTRIVILDTFHKFVWQVMDYVNVVSTFPDKIFLLAHAGGYDAREFVQIVRYKRNCWLDFSATQSIFGCADGNTMLDCGTRSVILHALSEPRINTRVLFGSDNPEFSQAEAVSFYESIGKDVMPMLNKNYENFIAFLI